MSTHGLDSPMSSGFFALPSTSAGRWSAWLLVAALALVLLNNLVVMPWTESATGLDTVQQISNLTAFAVLAVSGLTGLFAAISKHERSAVVFLSILLLVLAVALNIAELVG